MRAIPWQKRQAHEEQVRTILKNQGCLNLKNQIQAWKSTTWNALKEAGHTSLNIEKCACWQITNSHA